MSAIEITTQIGCYEKCSYCPQDKLIKAYRGKRKMSFTDFAVILQGIDSDIDIHFSGFCEPFLNKECADMINLCIDTGHNLKVFTRLKHLTDNDYAVLNLLPSYSIHVHCDQNYNGYEFNKLKKPQNLIIVGEEIVIGGLREWVITKQPIITRAGNIGTTDTYSGYVATKCIGNRQNQWVVLPNGNAVICCMDYSLTTIIGNLKENSLYDLKRSEKYIKFCNELKDGKNMLCNKCFRGLR